MSPGAMFRVETGLVPTGQHWARPPPAHLPPSPPGWEWGSHPSFLEGGGEWPEQGTPERLSACPCC